MAHFAALPSFFVKGGGRMPSLKDKVLALLEETRGGYCSGAHMANDLHVTRAAVWKAIAVLKQEGHAIEAVTNKGYRLRADSDLLSVTDLQRHLTGPTFQNDLIVLPTVDSTNNYLKNLAAAGAPHGTVVVSEEQTAGKGRFGRSFQSARGTGLYMSVLIRPEKRREMPLYTVLAAVSVAQTVEDLGCGAPQIKWVNDVLLNDKKICGILCEASMEMESGSLSYVVMGIGINVTSPPGGFEAPVAGALFPAGEKNINRNRLAAGVLNRLEANLSLPSRQVLEEYRRRLNLLGQRIVILGEEDQEWLVEELDEEGHLLVRDVQGKRRILRSGEVSVRKSYDKMG